MNNKILVIGDSCLDEFVYCKCRRLCPEAPVPLLDILGKSTNGGMAMNVFRNLKSLDADCDIITNKDWESVTKTRYVAKKTNHMFIRIDSPLRDERERINLDKINFTQYSVVVVADYNKGFLFEDDIKKIGELHPCVFLDTKKIIDDWARTVKFIKINHKEYKNSSKFIDIELENKIIETLGSGGCRLREKKFLVDEVEIKDLSGAGDSFLAALAIKYGECGDIYDSMKFANDCATIVVGKKGVSTIK
jgi:D-beta-D-heptose 7-phosphate kinase/D-beta-D-heptose 1-phosphate adenosyltransferase